MNVAIVSDDKGFRAVKDYWKARLNPTSRLVIKENIAACIISSAESYERRTAVQKIVRKISLEEATKKYNETKRIENELQKMFEDTECKELIPLIIDIVKGGTQPHHLYLNSLKTFGKKQGLRVYGILKNNRLELVNVECGIGR